MTVREVIAAIERWAPSGWAYAWDRAGLAIGEPNMPVATALAALTVTRDVYEAARAANAQLIIAHHPLIWDPLKNLRSDNPTVRLCLDIAQAGMACYSSHTSLDVAPGGVNHVLADRLGLLDKRPLFEAPHATLIKLITFVPETHLAAVREAICEAGAGIIGNYTHCTFTTPGTGTFQPNADATPFSGAKLTLNEEPELRFETLVPKARLADVLRALKSAHPYEEPAYDLVNLENNDTRVHLGIRGRLAEPMPLHAFARAVCHALDISEARVVGVPDALVETVACLGGAGGGETAHLPHGIDVYVTGDIKYHDAVTAHERGLALIDVGHAAAEQPIIPVLAAYLRKECAPLQVVEYKEPGLFQTINAS